MKRILLLLSILLLICRPSSAATGDIVSANIETNGWVMEVLISGYNTNGIFNFGFNTNNWFSSKTNVVLSVTSAGFDDTGASNTVGRTLYGTKQLRLAYPNNAFSDIQTNAGNAVIRVALSDFVFFTDSNLTVNISANWFSNNAAAVNLTVANNSTLTHPKCIANWSWPGWQHVTNSPMTVRAVGFHRSGQQGRPLRYMQFVARDQHSHAATNVVYKMSIDNTLGDPACVSEYIANMNVSGFTQGDLIRCDFRAVPWVGDSTSVLDTMDNVWSEPTGMWRSITNLCDLTGAYGVTRALVLTTGSDTLGRAANLTYWATNQNPPAFLTINAALHAIKGTNNAFYSHNDVGAGEVYVGPGSFTWTGNSRDTSGTPSTWCIITTNGGGTATLTGNSGNQSVANRTLVRGFSVTSSGVSLFSGDAALWLDKCSLNTSDTATIYQITAYYLTYCKVIAAGGSGLTGFSGVNASPVLLRGNDLSHSTTAMCYTVLANTRSTTNSIGGTSLLRDNYSGILAPQGTNIIIAYNTLYGIQGPGTGALLGISIDSTGYAIIQNLIEEVGTTSTPTLAMAGDNSAGTNVSNVIQWNNTLVGNRQNGPYNEQGTLYRLRTLWSKKNNCWDDDNIKADTFGTQNAARIGNWSCLYSVGSTGNWLGNVNNVGTSAFTHEEDGGFPGTWTAETPTQWPAQYQKFVSHKAWTGSVDQTGFGNYRLQSSSPLIPWNCEWVLPFDIEGTPRGLWDPPGAYASASPLKGSAGLGQ